MCLNLYCSFLFFFLYPIVSKNVLRPIFFFSFIRRGFHAIFKLRKKMKKESFLTRLDLVFDIALWLNGVPKRLIYFLTNYKFCKMIIHRLFGLVITFLIKGKIINKNSVKFYFYGFSSKFCSEIKSNLYCQHNFRKYLI